MRRSFLRVAMLLFVVGVASAPTARADAILIRSGGLSFDTGDPVAYGLHGDGLDLGGLFPAGGFPLPCSPGPCAPGSLINHGLVYGGAPTGFDLGLFFGNVLGTSYELSEDHVLRGTFEFLAPDVTIPDTGEFFLTVIAPFTFRGQAAGFRSSSTVPLFELSLRGRGQASMLLVGENGQYHFRALRYSFTPAVVPEPATFVLLGGGLAALWARRRSSAGGKGGSTD